MKLMINLFHSYRKMCPWFQVSLPCVRGLPEFSSSANSAYRTWKFAQKLHVPTALPPQSHWFSGVTSQTTCAQISVLWSALRVTQIKVHTFLHLAFHINI